MCNEEVHSLCNYCRVSRPERCKLPKLAYKWKMSFVTFMVKAIKTIITLVFHSLFYKREHVVDTLDTADNISDEAQTILTA